MSGVSGRKLAEELGVSEGAIRKLKAGLRAPSSRTAPSTWSGRKPSMRT